ncbi:hypothetical protein X971_4116 [Agrobacterium tumefaciens LBA4213 (Ach5)]|nr:hypothetical protein X971_4116 [Agrobacterium tumefaciens LBA4213 (Ach5)]
MTLLRTLAMGEVLPGTSLMENGVRSKRLPPRINADAYELSLRQP